MSSEYLLECFLSLAERLTGFRRKNFRIEDGEISCLLRTAQSTGGEAVVLLHGATGEARMWFAFARRLPRRLALIAPDLPGHGRSEARLDTDFSMARQADRMHELLSRFDHDAYHLVGNSMGGGIAIQLAARYPERIRSLTLIDSAGGNGPFTDLQREVLEGGSNPMQDIVSVEDLIALFRLLMSQPPHMPPRFVLDAMLREAIRRRPMNARILADVAAGLDMHDLLAAIRVATLIIWGEQDRILHPANAEILHAAIPGSTKLILAGVGHIPQIEAPQACVDAFLELLQQNPPSDPGTSGTNQA